VAASPAATGVDPEPIVIDDADAGVILSEATDPPEAAEARPAPEVPTTEPDPYLHVPFDIGLFPPLSINGTKRGHKIRNTISLGLGWTRVDRLEGGAAALGVTIVDEEAHGVTWAMVGNLTHGMHRGVQATSGFNHARQLHGAQFGGINHAHEVKGVQAGLLNVSRGRVRGVQFGLINYAEEADASFALVPVTKKGGIRPEVWTSDTAAINVGIRLPANYTYAFFAGGLHPIARKSRDEITPESGPRSTGTALMAGMGFGGHLPVSDEVSIEADLSGWVVSHGLRAAPPLGALTKLRAMLAWQLRPRIAIWGGPTLNVMVDREDASVARPGYGWISGSVESHGARVRWWPGFAAGLRF